MKKQIWLALILFMLSLNGTFADDSSLNCTYQEKFYTGNTTRVYYDSSGDIIQDPFSFTFNNGNEEGIGSCYCKFSFTVKNNVNKKISMSVYFTSFSGDNRHDNNKEIILNPYEIKTIRGEHGDACRASCGVIQNSVNYEFNTDSDVISIMEKIYAFKCKECDNTICLNDGDNCSTDLECGSGICNIAQFCGTVKVVNCPQKLRNCNNLSCMSPSSKNAGENYSCVWECKSGSGNGKACENTFRQQIPKYLYAMGMLITLILIIFFIWKRDTLK